MHAYALYWAKTDKENPDSKLWRPFAWHVAAVVACAEVICQRRPLLVQRVMDLLNCSETGAMEAVRVAAALHDLGKLCCLFQAKNAIGFKRVYGTDPTPYERKQSRCIDEGWFHGTDGEAAFREHIPTVDLRNAALYGSIHHGSNRESGRLKLIRDWCGRASGWAEYQTDLVAVRAFIADVLAEHVTSEFPKFPKSSLDAGQVLAGIVSHADWLGSDSMFPLKEDWPDHDYATAIRDPELRAIAQKRVTPEFEQLLPSDKPVLPDGVQLTMLQQAIAAQDKDIPLLSIEESPPGAGKTEASEFRHQNLVNAREVDRLVFCLPTQATTNSMHNRLRKSISRIYGVGERGVLLHHGEARGRLFALYGRDRQEDTDSSNFDYQWFRSGKRALLAPAAVVTLDQILLLALRGHRHAFVRQMALSTAHVVIDEVHDLDTYMEGVLIQVLQILGASGTRVTLLSATLTDRSRNRLLKAYFEGKFPGKALPNSISASDATRILSLYKDGRVTVEGLPSRRKDRSLRVKCWRHKWEFIDGMRRPHRNDVRTLLDSLVRTVKAGGCAGWIRNTVWDVQELVAEVKQYIAAGILTPDQVIFIQASLCPEDRSGRNEVDSDGGREGQIGRILGPPHDPTVKRKPVLVIGTSLLGVSLDIDFDRLVVDLNTLDNVLQAAGRHHRHDHPVRPPDCMEKVIELFIPEVMEARNIYDLTHPGEEYPLYRTWEWVNKEPTFTDPGGARSLLESVFDEKMPDASDPAYSRWERDEKVRGMLEKWVSYAVVDITGKKLPENEGPRKPTRIGDAYATLLMVKKDGTRLIVPHLRDKKGDPESVDVQDILALDPSRPWEIRNHIRANKALWWRVADLVKRGGARRSTFSVGEITSVGNADMDRLNSIWDASGFGTHGALFVPHLNGQNHGVVMRQRVRDDGTLSPNTPFNVHYSADLGLYAKRL